MSNTTMKTPNEKFSKKKPDVSHLKIFGSMAYYWLAKAQRTSKLAPTSKGGIFLGYDHLTHHVRIYCAERNNVILVRDVKILEEEMGHGILDKVKREDDGNILISTSR